MAKQLNMSDLFPEYVVQTVDGRTLSLRRICPVNTRYLFSTAAAGDLTAIGS